MYFVLICVVFVFYIRFFVEEEKNGVYNILGFFDEVSLLSRNPLGRELAWDYLRINYNSILETYGEEEPRIGRILIDIVRTFENEFLYDEVNDMNIKFKFYLNKTY